MADQQQQTERGPVLPPHTEDHGHSLAAWVGVSIVALGALISCLATVFTIWPAFWGGFVVMAIGPAVGKFLASKGHGASKPEQSSDAPHDTPHDLHGPR